VKIIIFSFNNFFIIKKQSQNAGINKGRLTTAFTLEMCLVERNTKKVNEKRKKKLNFLFIANKRIIQ